MSNQGLLLRIYNELLKLNKKVNDLIKIWAKGINRDLRKEDIQITIKCMKWFSTSFVFREMKIKTTKRYHYTSFRMAKIQNTDNTKMLIRMWSILSHCWCKIKTIQPLWKTVWCMRAKLLIMSNSLWVNYSLPGSSVHGILQARILQWVAMPSSRGLPDPGIKLTSHASCIGRQVLYHSATWEALNLLLPCNPAIILLGI